MYYYRNRMYDPELGRFLSKDPKGYVDGSNLYAYVRNNPVKYLDPMGTTTRQKFTDNIGTGTVYYSRSGRTDDYRVEYGETGYGYEKGINYKQYDISGNKTIFVHGTFSSPSGAESDFIDAIGKTYSGKVYQFDWSGKQGESNSFGQYYNGTVGADNKRESRENAAWRLTQSAESFNFTKGTTFNMVGHSHGGNLIKDFTQFYQGQKKLDNVTFMGTPVRTDHVINYNNFEKNAVIKNVYDSSDIVQRFGGFDNRGRRLADRKIQDNDSRVQNIQIEVDNIVEKPILLNSAGNYLYSEGIGDHSNMDSKKVWRNKKVWGK